MAEGFRFTRPALWLSLAVAVIATLGCAAFAVDRLDARFGTATAKEDTLTIANGVAGAYPNVFLEVSESGLPELVSLIRQLRSEADYSALLDRFGIRRTDPRFWSISDQVHADYRLAEPLTSGILDFSRYDNR